MKKENSSLSTDQDFTFQDILVSCKSLAQLREIDRLINKKQLLIGITGGIASGKTHLSQKLAEYSRSKHLSIFTVSMDVITREIHTHQTCPRMLKIRSEISQVFGPDILNTDSTTNRKKLAEYIFQNPENRLKLNRIMAPYLIAFTQKQIKKIKPPGIILIEAAILIEEKLSSLCDHNLLHIQLESHLQLKRLMNRDNISEKEAALRINSQYTDTERLTGIQDIHKKDFDRTHLIFNNSQPANISNLYTLIIREYYRKKSRASFFKTDIRKKFNKTFN